MFNVPLEILEFGFYAKDVHFGIATVHNPEFNGFFCLKKIKK